MNFALTFELIKNTIYKEYRNKTLIFAVIITILLIIVVRAVLNMDFFKQQDSLNAALITSQAGTLFFGVITLWNGILAALLGVNCIKSDFKHKVISQILSFPLRRVEYIIARIIGVWLLVVLYYIGSILISQIAITSAVGNIDINLKLFLSLAISSMSMLVLITLSVLYTFFLPKLQSFILVIITSAFCSYYNYRFSELPWAEKIQDLGFFKAIGMIVHYIFPRTGTIKEISQKVLSEHPNFQPNFLWWESSHFVVTYLLLFIVTCFIFKKKDIY